MATQWTPRYNEELALNGLTREQFLVLASEAVQQLGWEIYTINENGLLALTKKNILGAGYEVIVKIEGENALLRSASGENASADLGRNKKNIQALVKSIQALRETLTPEEMEVGYASLSPRFSAEAEEMLQIQTSETSGGMNSFFSLFKPVEGYYITPLLIDINVILFIGMVISGANVFTPDNESLLNWGASFKPLTLGGQWWRLLTSCFEHIGIIHLVMNMYALLYIGILLEPLLGKARFLLAYLLTGLVGSTASLWWHELSIGAGASGAIFGMYGVFLALLTTDFIEKSERRSMLSSISVFVGYNLLFGLQGNIDNSAHIGGLVSGLLIGYAMVPALKRPENTRLNYSSLAAIAAVVIVAVVVVFNQVPNAIGEYDKGIKEFSQLEERSLQIYSLAEDTPEDELLAAIKEKGINSWKQNIAILDGLKNLDLPDVYKVRLKELRDYSELRLKSFELFYQGTEEHTEKYQQELQECNTQIETIINRLNKEQE